MALDKYNMQNEGGMKMSELRRDVIRNNWVIIATDRALKPNDFPINKQGAKTAEFKGFCPFCEGNESFTPEEIAAYRRNDTQANLPGWQVRTIPNKFSALELKGSLIKINNGVYSSYNGLGKHEVVVETPQHEIDLPEYSLDDITLILNMLKSRYDQLMKDERIKYIHIYKNHGLYAGASLGHSHSQIVGLPIFPNENRGIDKYYKKTGRCLLCDILEQEINDRERVIYETDHFVLICPFASRFSYETWIIPRKHTAHFMNVGSEEVKELAAILKYFSIAIKEGLNDPSYNMIIVSAPVNVENPIEGYHWYIELTPRLIVSSGLEIGTGYYVNPVAPEISASILKESLFKALA
ncbi:MAG: galactose-1-phosphate uridylyltransferase [Veillonellales bacterium]